MEWIPNALSHVNIRTALLGLLVFVVLSWLVRRPRNLPPGPWGWPLLGSVPLLAMIKEPTHEAISKMGKRFGSVFSFNVFNQLVVVLQDYDVIKEAMDQHQLSGRPVLEISQITLPGSGIITASGKAWVELRRFSATALRKLGMGKSTFEKNISIEAKYLLEEIKKRGDESFDPKNILESVVANIICYLVFGNRFEYTDTKFKELHTVLNRSFEISGAGGVIEFVPIIAKMTFLPVVKKHITVNLACIKIMRDLLKDHEKEYKHGISRDYTDAFYNEMKAKESQGVDTSMNPVSLFYSVSAIFAAGMETTTTTFRWALLFMIAYPEIQTRVQQELDSVVGRDRLPKLSDKPELPFTEAVLFEIQRLGSVVPLGVPHKCMEDTTVSGYLIPEGAIVLTNLWHILNDAGEWTNPMEFRPERFLDSNSKIIRREKFIPFGLGRRVCLGEQLAKMELFVIFTALLHQFTFKTPEGASVSFEANEGITHAPIGYKINAIPRD